MTSLMIMWTNDCDNDDENHYGYDEHDGSAPPLAVYETSHSYSGGGPKGELLLFGQKGVEDGTRDLQSSTDYLVFWHGTPVNGLCWWLASSWGLGISFLFCFKISQNLVDICANLLLYFSCISILDCIAPVYWKSYRVALLVREVIPQEKQLCFGHLARPLLGKVQNNAAFLGEWLP